MDHGIWISWETGADFPALVLAKQPNETVDLEVHFPGGSGVLFVPGIPVKHSQAQEDTYRVQRDKYLHMRRAAIAAAQAEFLALPDSKGILGPVYSDGRAYAPDYPLDAPAIVRKLSADGKTADLHVIYSSSNGWRNMTAVPIKSAACLSKWLAQRALWLPILEKHMSVLAAEWAGYTEGTSGASY